MAFSNAPSAHPTAPGSETELFLLSGADRADLCRLVAELQAFCRREPGVNPTDLAFTLNVQTALQPARLAVVAKSIDDLAEKLARAANRLADASCRQIRDVQGIYFFEQPLAPAGKLAVLFPGEGAPYLGMLGNLPARFPEVAQVISQCDEMSRGQGNAPLSRFLSVPVDLAERAALDRELSGLGNTMFSVLMADWALMELFRAFGLAPDAVAGHSAGELAALWISGCLVGSLDLPDLHRTMDFLEADEASGEPQSVLLAVGASRETMSELLAQAAKKLGESAEVPPLYLAMDNCPHQTVVIGRPDAMALVEAVLRERKVMHERLPFSRPYHTPLFEPQLGPLARMFDKMEFQTPTVTLYSCSTGRPFPNDPKAIHEMAMTNWIRPVEFSQMIRNMHDDGVRIFLEVGPRGNVTAFVADILRGREFHALAADVQRQTGRTQLHHVLGQLLAHHVPLRLDPLYQQRTAGSLENAECGMRNAESLRLDPFDQQRTAPGRAGVVNDYWQVMEQFLHLQQDVMRQYLQQRRVPGITLPSPPQAPAAQPTPEMPSELFVSELQEQSPSPASIQPVAAPGVPAHQLPLVGEVVRFVPGEQLVVRRCLDLAEDVYGDHHTVGGREVSYVYPERNGQPVVPMTFSLELMAEAGTLLVPGFVVTAIRNVQLARWLVFDEDCPHTIELTARLIKHAAGNAELEMRIFDLGFEPDRPDHKGDLAAVATVEMADRYPAPPPVEDFPLSGERPCRIPLDVLYKNLFHGERFQGTISLDRYGTEGIQGQIRVLPREGLFRSNPDPQFVLDPVLMDVAMHPLAGWHLEQSDQSGRILLPYELGDIRFFGPRPAVGTEMTSRGRILHESARRFTHTVEVVGPRDRLWCTMQKLKYWRFYLPFGEFNFHGPKDDYFLSENWPEAIESDSDIDTAQAWCVGLLPPRDLQAPGMMLASARVTLTEDELRGFRRLELPDAKKSEWLFGRMAAKDAARILWRSRTGERMVPADIAITPDENGRPIASPIGQDRPENFPQVSIAHAAGVVTALGAFDRAPGIDIERIEPRDESFEKAAFSLAERELIAESPTERAETLTRFWCAKEAVSKAVGQGLVDGPQSLAVIAYNALSGSVTVEIGPRLAERLDGEFAGGPFVVRTLKKDEFIIATILLERVCSCPVASTTSFEKSPSY